MREQNKGVKNMKDNIMVKDIDYEQLTKARNLKAKYIDKLNFIISTVIILSFWLDVIILALGQREQNSNFYLYTLIGTIIIVLLCAFYNIIISLFIQKN